MTKKEMISEMIGNVRTTNMDGFWKRAIAKDKEWITKAYNLYKKDLNEGRTNCRHFYFALLNK